MKTSFGAPEFAVPQAELRFGVSPSPDLTLDHEKNYTRVARSASFLQSQSPPRGITIEYSRAFALDGEQWNPPDISDDPKLMLVMRLQ